MTRLFIPVLASLTALSVSGCFSLEELPPSGYEVDYISCADGRDNDFDGRIDCMDNDCVMRGHCGEQIPIGVVIQPENTFELCRDGIDNDDDGTFDCGDRDCVLIFELCCLGEADDVTCADGRDNDGNGFTDCADFTCRNNRFVTVCEDESICDDGIDNDGDRYTDCADSECTCTEVCNPGCRGPEDTLERCQDGFDNDGNGFVDCLDFSCSDNPNPAVMALCAGGGTETTLEECSNDIDEDGNGFTDCEDFSCSDPTSGATPEAAAYCAARAENTLDRCFDGIDNDDNGFIDCLDFSCSRSLDPVIAERCRVVGEATFESCTDNRDNDNNGYTDCADFSCRFVIIEETGFCSDVEPCPVGQSCYRGICVRLQSPCEEGGYFDGQSDTQGTFTIDLESDIDEQIAMSVAQCTDGIDNDNDGFTDCEDWECNHNPRVVDAMGDPLCRFAGGRTCLMGPRAGSPCSGDADCSGIIDACSEAGIAGNLFICP